MKVKEIAEKYNIDATAFERFLLLKELPYKVSLSGAVVSNKDVEKYVKLFEESGAEVIKEHQILSEEKEKAAAERAIENESKVKQTNHKLQLLFTLNGCRGRTLMVCRNKCIIKTAVTVGSVLTNNATDGEKIIFFKHCAGLQFKEAGLSIGYLQFETPSMQMNNQSSNFFSENTFTFDQTNSLTNGMMREVFYYVMELIENCISGETSNIPQYPPLLADYLREHQ